jgi:multicomponent Na+:H+ antiporter subunit B
MDIAVGIEVTGGLTLILLYMFKGTRMFNLIEMGGETGHDSR